MSPLAKLSRLFGAAPARESSYEERVTPVAIFSYPRGTLLLAEGVTHSGQAVLRMLKSTDGNSFAPSSKEIVIENPDGSAAPIDPALSFSAVATESGYLLSYLVRRDTTFDRVTAEAARLGSSWSVRGTTSDVPFERLALVVARDCVYAYAGRGALRLLELRENGLWRERAAVLAEPRENAFDNGLLFPIMAQRTTNGILLLYESREVRGNTTTIRIGALLTNTERPEEVFWRSDTPLWEYTFPFVDTMESIGGVIGEDCLSCYWATEAHGLIVVTLPNTLATATKTRAGKARISRHPENPLLSPRQEFFWESRCVLNPAVILGDDNRVHMLYRAIGDDGVSRIGYATSADGIHFDDRHPYPAFALDNPRTNVPLRKQHFSFALYPSGGSWGGCEDPRMVRMDGKIYLSFNAFDGWDFIRVGITSIDEEDFFNREWRWQKPLYLSPPGEIHKNWVIFPEKINGKFAVLHNLHHTDPDRVRVDYIDDLSSFDSEKIRFDSPDPNRMPHRPSAWHTRMRSPGSPPLKTDRGWLVFYHAHERDEPHRYKLGAVLLDLLDPSVVLARAKTPILEPDMWYENDWKPGIIYVCGTIIKDGTLFIYYGGGDKYICVATAPLSRFLEQLKENRAPALKHAEVV